MSDVFLTRTLSSSDDELFEDLARNAIGTEIAQGLVQADEFEEQIAVGFDALENLRELGLRIFGRVSREFYDVICGNSKSNSDDRNKILNASGLSDAIVLTALASALSGAFDFGVSICTILASLIFRRIVKPAGDEVCKYWKERFL